MMQSGHIPFTGGIHIRRDAARGSFERGIVDSGHAFQLSRVACRSGLPYDQRAPIRVAEF